MVKVTFVYVLAQEKGPRARELNDALTRVFDGRRPWIGSLEDLPTPWKKFSGESAHVFASCPVTAEQIDLAWAEFAADGHRGVVEIDE